MAQCKDCIHCAVCERLEEFRDPLGWINTEDEFVCSYYREDADVVPKSEVDKLEYTLTGVMHSVDKWLDGEELEQDEVNRAITMREKTLRIVEQYQEKLEDYKDCWYKIHDSYNADCRESYNIGRQEVAMEIFEEIEKDGKYAISFVENHKSYSEEVRQAKLECYKDIQTYIAELKKKYTEEKQ